MPERGKKRKNDGESSQEESISDPRAYGKKHRRLFREKGELTDITFLIGPDSIPFKVHKLIMALASPVFEAMFFGPILEKEDAIKVIDILPDGFENMLRFIYGEELCFESEMAVFQTWIAGDKFCLIQLKKECEAYLNKCSLKPSNICLILDNSVSCKIISVTNRCLEYLKPRMQTFLRLPEFLDVSADTLRKVSSITRTGSAVLGLLRALLLWAKCKVENGEAESNLEVLSPLLKHIHFGAMDTREFSAFLSGCGNLISPQDAVSIYMHLYSPKRFKLPKWCSTKTCLRSSALP